jgi:hypothetical protein
MVNIAFIGWHRHRQTSSSQGLPLQSTMKSAANTSKHRGTGMMAATAAETAAAACSHMNCKHSWTSKLVAAPQAANSGNLSKRKAQSRMTAESPCEFDKYLKVTVNKAHQKRHFGTHTLTHSRWLCACEKGKRQRNTIGRRNAHALKQGRPAACDAMCQGRNAK